MDDTVLAIATILIIIAMILIFKRAYRWIHINDSPYVAQQKNSIIRFFISFIIPVVAILCLFAAALFNMLFHYLLIALPYLLAAGGVAVLAFIIRSVKNKQEGSESLPQQQKPRKLKKADKAPHAKKFRMVS